MCDGSPPPAGSTPWRHTNVCYITAYLELVWDSRWRHLFCPKFCALCKNWVCSYKQVSLLKRLQTFEPIKSLAIDILGPLLKGRLGFQYIVVIAGHFINGSRRYFWGTSARWMSFKHYWNIGFRNMDCQRFESLTTEWNWSIISFRVYISYLRSLLSLLLHNTLSLMRTRIDTSKLW